MNFGKYVITVLLSFFVLMIPVSAYAASSTAVTSTFESTNLKGEDFSGKNLQLAEFTKVNLEQANFSNADLRGSVFNVTAAVEANFHGADLTNGLTYVSNFDKTDLSDAIFREAMMLRTTFKGAKIEGADFTLAILDKLQVKNLCEYASGINSKTGASTRQSLGCP